MKHFFKYIILSVIIVLFAFILFYAGNKYKLSILCDDVEWSIDTKGLKNSVDFEKSDGNTYVAYKSYVKVIDDEGSEKKVFENENLNIEKIVIDNRKIYFLSDDKLYCYDSEKDKFVILAKDLPYRGLNLDRQLMMYNGKLLLAIGSASNSGIAEYAEICEGSYDKTSINITLTGENYGESKTGAYMPYGNSSVKGQKIKAEKFGNSSVFEINPLDQKAVLFACGIRNITGWDTDSNGKLICIVGGGENKGIRPINRDSDYLYKIEKGQWYGWPDYSGGDPITSPRFKKEKCLTNLLSTHPNKSVAPPLYVFDEVNCKKYLAVDKEGDILEKDSVIFYDKNKNYICSLSMNGVKKNLLKLKSSSNIKNIKIKNNNAYILDNGTGCIYKMQNYNKKLMLKIPIQVLAILIVILLSVVFVIIIKNNKKMQKR